MPIIHVKPCTNKRKEGVISVDWQVEKKECEHIFLFDQLFFLILRLDKVGELIIPNDRNEQSNTVQIECIMQ